MADQAALSASNIAANSAASGAASTAASSGASFDIGKALMISQGLQSALSLAGGIAGMGASNQEAAALNAQADLALQEAEANARQKRAQVIAFRENQAQAYNSSGVLLEGTPLTVLASTVRKGNEEISAIEKRGQAMANLYRSKAGQTKSSGVAGLTKSALTGLGGFASTYVKGYQLGLFGNNAPAAAATATQASGIDVYTGGIA